MLVLKLEWQDAQTGEWRQVGHLRIVNTGSGTTERGDYHASLNYVDAQDKDHDTRFANVYGFPRQRKSAWDLTYQVLQYILGHDNPAFAYAGQELYVKREGEYVQVAQFEGFPMNGVFLVHKTPSDKRSWTGYEWIGDLPREDALTYALARIHLERAGRKVMALQESRCGLSVADLVNAVLDAIAEGEKESGR